MAAGDTLAGLLISLTSQYHEPDGRLPDVQPPHLPQLTAHRSPPQHPRDPKAQHELAARQLEPAPPPGSAPGSGKPRRAHRPAYRRRHPHQHGAPGAPAYSTSLPALAAVPVCATPTSQQMQQQQQNQIHPELQADYVRPRHQETVALVPIIPRTAAAVRLLHQSRDQTQSPPPWASHGSGGQLPQSPRSASRFIRAATAEAPQQRSASPVSAENGFDLLAVSLSRCLQRAAAPGFDGKWRMLSAHLDRFGHDVHQDVAVLAAQAGSLIQRHPDGEHPSAAAVTGAVSALLECLVLKLPELQTLAAAVLRHAEASIFAAGPGSEEPEPFAGHVHVGWRPGEADEQVIREGAAQRKAAYMHSKSWQQAVAEARAALRRRLKASVKGVVDRTARHWQVWGLARVLGAWRTAARQEAQAVQQQRVREGLEGRLKQLQEELEERERVLEQQRREHGKAVAALRREIADITTEASVVQELMQKKDTECSYLNAELNELRNHRQIRETEIDVARTERSQLDELLRKVVAPRSIHRIQRLQVHLVSTLRSYRGSALPEVLCVWANDITQQEASSLRLDTDDGKSGWDNVSLPSPPRIERFFTQPQHEAEATYYLMWRISPLTVTTVDVMEFRGLVDDLHRGAKLVAAAKRLQLTVDFTPTEYLTASGQGSAVRRRVLAALMLYVLDAALSPSERGLAAVQPRSPTPPGGPRQSQGAVSTPGTPRSEPGLRGSVGRIQTEYLALFGDHLESPSEGPLASPASPPNNGVARGPPTQRSRAVLDGTRRSLAATGQMSLRAPGRQVSCGDPGSPKSSCRQPSFTPAHIADSEPPVEHSVLPEGALAPWQWREEVTRSERDISSVHGARVATVALLMQDIAAAERAAARDTPKRTGGRDATHYVSGAIRSSDLFSTTGEDPGAGRGALEEQMMALWPRLHSIYHYYATSDKKQLDTVLSRSELERMLQDARVFDSATPASRRKSLGAGSPVSPVSPRRLTWQQDMRKGSAALQEAFSQDRMTPADYAEVLCRIACSLGQHPTMAERLRGLYDRYLVPHACYASLADFREQINTLEAQGVINDCRGQLLNVFGAYAALDIGGGGVGNSQALSFAQFKKLMDDIKAVDEVCTHTALHQLFLKVQNVGEADDARCTFADFITLVCAVAAFKHPAPYLPIHLRVRYFITNWLAHAPLGRTLQAGRKSLTVKRGFFTSLIPSPRESPTPPD